MKPDSIVGGVPPHWEITSLGDLCERTGGNIQTGPFGSQLHASDYVPVGVPSIMPVNIGDNRIIESGIVRITDTDAKRLTKYRVRHGDIVYSRRGDVERRALVTPGEDGWLCGTGCLRVRLGEGVSSEFVSYQLGHPIVRAWIVQHAVGATMPNLNTKILSALPVVVPPITEQEEIAASLGAIDKKIANNRALAADLEAMARATFKSWFVDFDPVKAKMEGRAPVGMDADSAALFPDELVESELGLTPKGWSAGTLSDLSRLNPESWSARKHPETIVYVDLAGTDRGQIVSTTSFNWSDAPSRARRVLKTGDTIVGTVRPGNRAYSYVGEDGLTGSTGFAALRPNTPSLRAFVYLAATSNESIDRLTNLADGAAYPAVRPDVVSATPVVLPPDDLVERFAARVQCLLDWIVNSHVENAELATLRDALLPKLISGKIRVPDSTTALEEP